ncbi:Type II/IV secretion system protein [uncultured archaeon]|nr:Type II/IV secretion system protein [uncultured archaeon]
MIANDRSYKMVHVPILSEKLKIISLKIKSREVPTVTSKENFGKNSTANISEGLKEKIKEEYADLKNYLHVLLRGKLKLEPYIPEKFEPLVSFKRPEGYVEKERYWVNEPYAFVSILFNEDEKEFLYFAAEPELSAFERMVLETVYENILDTLTVYETSDKAKSELLEKKTLELIDGYSIEIGMLSIHKILYYIKRDYIGYERIDVLMRDPNIEDISCDGSGIPIFVYHRKHQNIKTNISFEAARLDSFVMKLAQRCGKHVSIGEPLINSTLPDGSRLNASLGKEVTFRGGTFTIRKFREQAFTPAELIKNGTYSKEILAYLWLAVENGKSMVFAGATAAGKTSSLNAVSLFIPSMAKIVSIEDTHELMLHHDNWIGSITREAASKTASGRDIDMYELLRQALRQRPEYIIVGEIRGKEAMTLFQAMSTGHTTYSTMHADSVNTVISRLEGDPINIPRAMIQSLDLLSIQKVIQFEGKRMRRLDTVIEFMGIDPTTQDLKFNDIYAYDPKTDAFKTSGKSFVLEDIMARRNWDEKKLREELENRKKLLDYMVEKDMDEFDIVSLIQSYYVNPEKTMIIMEGRDANKAQISSSASKDTKECRKLEINLSPSRKSGEEALWKKSGRITITKKSRFFFPGYKVPFIIESDKGLLNVEINSARKGTAVGDPIAGKYLQGSDLQVWFHEHQELHPYDRMIFEIVEPGKKYKMYIKKKLTTIPQEVAKHQRMKTRRVNQTQ